MVGNVYFSCFKTGGEGDGYGIAITIKEETRGFKVFT